MRPARSRRAPLIAVLLVGLACARKERGWIPLTTASEDARRAFVVGVRDFHLLKMSSARAAFEKAIAADRDVALAHAYRAVAMNFTGDWAASLAEAERRGAKATEAERLLIRATRAWTGGDHDGAISSLDTLAGLAPRDPAVPFRIGVHHLARRRDAEAAAAFDRSLALRPEFAPGAILLARAHAYGGRHKEARAAADRATTLVPKEPLAHFISGEAHERAHEWDPAIAAYSRALALDPAFVPAYLGRAHALRVKEDFPAARRDYEAAFARTSALTDGAYKEHLLDWTKAEDISFDAAMTHLLEGNVDAATAGGEATAAYCDRVRPQSSPFYYDALGRMYLEAGRLEEAWRAYEKGHLAAGKLELPADEKTLWRGRWVHAQGRVHARAHRFREAHAQAALLEKMIADAGEKGEPYRPSLHYLRGYIRLEEGRAREALAELEQAEQRDMFNQWLLSRAHRMAGEEAAAKAIEERILAQRGGGFTYALARWHLVFERGGRGALSGRATAK